MTTEPLVRPRREADLPGCVAALRAVHDADAYPLNWPEDPIAWLAPQGLAQAWVAELAPGTIAGHVAILGGELTRLFVTPAARRRAVGRRWSAWRPTGPRRTTCG
ncbi:hypothetical protein [Asanoa sp. NPDC050611]|uniref:hypothetical protein n=1 Tax=Asanoa sp. NPDC050611 TaxID=3157098 RepID=UPI0033C8419B